jgi:hypothetical protein
MRERQIFVVISVWGDTEKPRVKLDRRQVYIKKPSSRWRNINLKLPSIAVIVSCSVLPAFGQAFVPECKIRFQLIAQAHPIDNTCGKEGAGAKRQPSIGPYLYSPLLIIWLLQQTASSRGVDANWAQHMVLC